MRRRERARDGEAVEIVGHAQVHVEPLFDHVERSIGEADVEVDRRVARRERREEHRQVSIEVEGAADAQHAVRLARHAADGRLRLVEREQALDAALEVDAPSLRHGYAARRSVEEARAHARFDRGDVLGDRRG